MYSALSGKTTDEVVEDFTGKETVELKDGLTQPIQEKIIELEEDEGHIEQILADGARRAHERVSVTIRGAKELLGLN
uniref:Tryptophanyl-tRNA synthetase n=1 Tax=Amphimedon queenslandica TaxID=400682 RepID=A0A1X7V037_AMPQE